MLGGSSSLGNLLYTRGSPHDLDEWAKFLSTDSWSYKNVIKYYKKSEDLDYKDYILRGSNEFHNRYGELGVQKVVHEISQSYLNMFKEAGHKIIVDGNRNISLGYYEPMFMIKNGVRQSTAFAFLPLIRKRPNLHVLKNTEVTKVHLKNLIATGITAFQNGKEISVNATREVIISAGTFNSAKLLMLSGVGPKDQLRAHDILIKKDLPVGKFFQDHLAVFLVHKFNRARVLTNRQNPHEVDANMIVGNVAGNKLKLNAEYQTINYIMPHDSDKLLSLCSVMYSFSNEICDSIFNKTKGFETLLTMVVLLHPTSRGHIDIQSKDYRDPPNIISGFYSHEDDITDMVDYVTDFLKIQKTSSFKRYGGEFVAPKLKGCDEYVGEDYWKCYSLNMIGTAFDYAGSCAMGMVVDEKLRVYGLSKLRVIDASVIPLMPSGNIQADVMAIAEKGADIVLNDAKQQYAC